jgi:hypothetical protein
MSIYLLHFFLEVYPCCDFKKCTGNFKFLFRALVANVACTAAALQCTVQLFKNKTKISKSYAFRVFIYMFNAINTHNNIL